MRCPGNEEHEGIKVVFQNASSPHYAAAKCRECGLWIKWLNRAQADDILLIEEARTGEKQYIRPELFPPELEARIREIVREEQKKVRG